MKERVKPIKIIKDSKYPNMYRLQWANGDISIRTWDTNLPKSYHRDGFQESYGMYNLTRAKDILKHYILYRNNMKRSINYKSLDR